MMRFRPLLTLLLLFGACLSAAAGSEPLRILFVGNSYTGQIKSTLQQMVAASGHSKSELMFITPGGRTLRQHLENPETLRRIRDGGWDFVVLQDQSQTPAVFPDRFAEAAKELDEIIDKSGAMTVFYQTWGRRDGDQQNTERFPSYEKMQDALSEAYAASAKKLKAKLSPVGETWRAVRNVDEDLGKNLYKNDGSHPSSKGAFLVACVFYATLFEDAPAKVQFDGGLPAAEAELIRRLAWRKVTTTALSR